MGGAVRLWEGTTRSRGKLHNSQTMGRITKKHPKRKDNLDHSCISPNDYMWQSIHSYVTYRYALSLFLQAGSRHRSAITWESPTPPLCLCFTLSLTLSFHVELLLSLSSCYLWNWFLWRDDTEFWPQLPAAALPTMVLSFTHLANICWLLARCPFHLLFFWQRIVNLKTSWNIFKIQTHSWLVDWLRTKTF